jgi:hypothetical protein
LRIISPQADAQGGCGHGLFTTQQKRLRLSDGGDLRTLEYATRATDDALGTLAADEEERESANSKRDRLRNS